MYLRTDRTELRDNFAECAAKTDTDNKNMTQAPWLSGNLDTAQARFASSYARRFCVLDIAPVKNTAPLQGGMALFILQIYVSDTEHYVEKLDVLAKKDNIEYVPFIGHLQRLARGQDAGLPLHTWLFADKQPAIKLTTGIGALDTCTPLTQFHTSHISSDRFKVPAGDPFADFIDLVGDEAARCAQWKIIADSKYPARPFPTALERLAHRVDQAKSHIKPQTKRRIK